MPFEREKLPDPEFYYSSEVEQLKHRGKYMQGLCPFHGESKPSFSVNTETGSYKCFSCGERGRDVLDFQKKRYSQEFKEAAQALGAWS